MAMIAVHARNDAFSRVGAARSPRILIFPLEQVSRRRAPAFQEELLGKTQVLCHAGEIKDFNGLVG